MTAGDAAVVAAADAGLDAAAAVEDGEDTDVAVDVAAAPTLATTRVEVWALATPVTALVADEAFDAVAAGAIVV